MLLVLMRVRMNIHPRPRLLCLPLHCELCGGLWKLTELGDILPAPLLFFEQLSHLLHLHSHLHSRAILKLFEEHGRRSLPCPNQCCASSGSGSSGSGARGSGSSASCRSGSGSGSRGSGGSSTIITRCHIDQGEFAFRFRL